MSPNAIRIFFYWLFTRLTLRYPKVITNEGRKYVIKEWKGGTFYYITYWWNGSPLDEALDIIRGWIKLSLERGKNEQVLGRYPNDEEWQIGMITKSKLDLKKFKGRVVQRDEIPGGKYAWLEGKGYPEHIFAYWFWLKRKLRRDHLEIISPTFEFYEKDTFNKLISDRERKGRISYQIKGAA